MNLKLVAVFRADRQSVDYTRVPPLEVRMNFIATFQPEPGETLTPEGIVRLLDLPWVPSNSYDEITNQVTIEVSFNRLLESRLLLWEMLIFEVNLAYAG